MRTRILSLVLLLFAAALPAAGQAQVEPVEPVAPSGFCARQLFAHVVALDQPYFWNRLGAVQPHGMVYALRRDVVAITGSVPGPGNARLRSEKRPRPLVLRMNEGDCLTVRFTNWLGSTPADNEQVRTREASVHVTGMQLVSSIAGDGSWVGTNASSLAAPGQTRDYKFFAQKEGGYVLHSAGALTSGEGENGTISAGLFGAVNVEPNGSTWYRSQVTEPDLARTITSFKELLRTDNGVTWTERHPVINYSALHPATHPSRPGLPVLKMLAGPGLGAPPGTQFEIIYSDLTAIVVQAAGIPPGNPAVYPRPSEPFREFTIIFHDEPGAVQAFAPFYDRDAKGNDPATGLAYTLHSVRDAFGINYGTGGVGAEILANRLGVGPMHDCEACRYEEFFLSSWAVGDPAMVVDVPANAPCDDDPFDNYQGPGAYKTNTVSHYAEMEENHQQPTNPCAPTPGPKATLARYPDDPSNVYHSYLDDHVKFRNLLAGSDDHHIFHLHAHQWLHTPNEDNSAYKDSQAIGQGTAFTYEIAHEGSGNRNKTPGDSIFHCHFYPHFAMGMWGLWRVHDVLELGTKIDAATGRPKAGARALPDGEIAAGTPIPGLVPLPGEPMPPPPSVAVSIVGGQVQIASIGGLVYGNPGYPFYVPGIAGKRVPEPPMDIYVDENGVHHDGGLPRNVIVDADIALELHTRLDFTKDITNIDAVQLAGDGEPWEKSAMRWHADQIDGANDGFMTTYRPNGTLASGTAGHEINGSDPIAGAPYADPCYRPAPTGYPNAQFDRTYKAANIQMDVAFNAAGWHFPQQRFLSLWGDVNAFLGGGKDPEPLFIRANTYDCVTYLHTNLVPSYYEMDDFQVRTPTDILGQHIHLVKFDVTSSDGSANGFNYEDGTLSFEEVQHLIAGINLTGGIIVDPENPDDREPLTVRAHPFFGIAGARTTVQRWYVDDVLNNYDDNRSLRTVFTHDHFGPSTHQQVGLYAGLLTYKGTTANTTWHDAVTGQVMGGRFDGGPTSWQAVIRGPEKFREFALEFGDFQLAYWPNETFPDPANAVNPPGRVQQWDQLTAKPWIYEKPALVGRCPNGALPPCPEAISADDPGAAVVNYKSEPIALRVTDNSATSPTLSPAPRGDLSYAFSSTVHGDPFTPILKAYEQDEVRMRILVGAHEEEHNFSVHGARWLTEPDAVNSGYKSSQMMGISEWYEFEIPHLLGAPNPATGFVDFLYKAGSSAEDLWNGIWGLIRVYDQPRLSEVEPIDRSNPVPSNTVDVEPVPGAPVPTAPTLTTAEGTAEGTVVAAAPALAPIVNHASVCPSSSLPARVYDLVAVSAAQALPGGRLVYNPRPTPLQNCTRIDRPYGYLDDVACSGSGLSGPLVDPTAILFVRASDLNPDLTLKATAPIEPLILRARAGECIKVKLTNRLPAGTYAADRNGYSLLPNVLDEFNQNQVPPSARVGLHPTLLSYDGLLSDGVNVGFNPEQSVAPNQSRTYVWYAGSVTVAANGTVTGTPIEFGAVPIYSTDPIKHTNKGAVGAIIIEPAGSTWWEYPASRAKAIVDPTPFSSAGDSFREFVLVVQDDINLYFNDEEQGDLAAVRPLAVNEDPTETGQTAFNYKTEPVWFRKEYLPQLPPEVTRNFQMADSFSNGLVGGDPVTPLFRAAAGDLVRFRVVHPGGDSQQHTWGLHGHIWQEQPWTNASTKQGNNPFSEWKGVEYGLGPTGAMNFLPVGGAGGAFQVDGDYMYRDYVPWYLANGLWGIFRVFDSPSLLSVEEPGWPVDPNFTETGAESTASTATMPAAGFDATVPQQ